MAQRDHDPPPPSVNTVGEVRDQSIGIVHGDVHQHYYGGDRPSAGEAIRSQSAAPPPGTSAARPPTRRVRMGLGLAAALAAAAFFAWPEPPDWPGPPPVEVTLAGSTLLVDVDEVRAADLGACRGSEPTDRRWCAALRAIVDPARLESAVVEGVADPAARIVVGLGPDTAEAICALRGMRLPTDTEFMALAASGEPTWPATRTVAAVIAADVRGAQRLKGLSTGAVEWVRAGGGYIGRGTPMLSGAAVDLVRAHRTKLLGDLTRPGKREPSETYADFGFRCVRSVP